MPHEFLESIYINTSFEHTGCIGMAQCMPDNHIACIHDSGIEAVQFDYLAQLSAQIATISPCSIFSRKQERGVGGSRHPKPDSVQVFGIELPEGDDSGISSLGGTVCVRPFEDADHCASGINRFPSQMDKFTYSDSRIQRKKYHVVHFPSCSLRRVMGENGIDFFIIQDTQTPRVKLCNSDTPVSASGQEYGIQPRKKHHIRRFRYRRLSCIIINFTDGFQNMQDSLWRKSCFFIIFIASGTWLFGCNSFFQILDISLSYGTGRLATKKGKNVVSEVSFNSCAILSIFLNPFEIVVCQVTKSNISGFCGFVYSLLSSTRFSFHFSLFLERLWSFTQANIFAKHIDQLKGYLSGPSFACPAKGFRDAFAMVTVPDCKEQIWFFAIFSIGMSSEQYTGFTLNRMPVSVRAALGFVKQVFLVIHWFSSCQGLQRFAGIRIISKSIEIARVVMFSNTLQYQSCFLLSCRPQVRFLPGAPYSALTDYSVSAFLFKSAFWFDKRFCCSLFLCACGTGELKA